jgi:hypothetical protein
LKAYISLVVKKYVETGDVEDLNNAIIRAKEILKITPHLHPDRSLRYGDLSKLKRFRIDIFNHDLESQLELDRAIEYRVNRERRNPTDSIRSMREALEATPKSHPQRPQMANELAGASLQQFTRNTTGEGLDTFIENLLVVRQVFKDSKLGRPRAILLGTLGRSLIQRTNVRFSLDDLRSAIMILKEAIEASRSTDNSSTSDSIFAMGLNLAQEVFGNQQLSYIGSLGIALHRSFIETKNIDDLRNAIPVLEQRWNSTLEKDDETLQLGEVLFRCYRDLDYHTGNLKHCQEGLALVESILSYSESSFVQNERLNLLRHHCTALIHQYIGTSDLDDLRRTITTVEAIVEQFPSDHSKGLACLSDLFDLYRLYWKRSFDPKSLENCFRIAKQAVARTKRLDDNSLKALAFQKTAEAFRIKFDVVKDKTIINEAVKCADLSVQHTDVQDTDFHRHVGRLAKTLWYRYRHLKDRFDLERAIQVSETAMAIKSATDRNQFGYLISTLSELLAERFSVD